VLDRAGPEGPGKADLFISPPEDEADRSDRAVTHEGVRAGTLGDDGRCPANVSPEIALTSPPPRRTQDLQTHVDVDGVMQSIGPRRVSMKFPAGSPGSLAEIGR